MIMIMRTCTVLRYRMAMVAIGYPMIRAKFHCQFGGIIAMIMGRFEELRKKNSSSVQLHPNCDAIHDQGFAVQ